MAAGGWRLACFVFRVSCFWKKDEVRMLKFKAWGIVEGGLLEGRGLLVGVC